MSPSLHRVLQHIRAFMNSCQNKGFTLGELSECGQEAINVDGRLM